MQTLSCVTILLFLLSGDVRALTQAEIDLFVARTHIETNTQTQGTVSIVTDDSDETAFKLTSNGIPDHDTGTFPGQGNPNALESQNYQWRIPKNPQQASTTTCLPQGPIGMALNGVPIFNPYSITCCDTGVEELDLFDTCMGHPAPNPEGAYHYHINPQCLFRVICNQPSTIVGVAFDGFPIYGPNDEDGTQLTVADLDECNGKVTNGQYRYHITADFPYFLGCFKGSVRSDAGIPTSNQCQCTSVTSPCQEFSDVSISRKKREIRPRATFVCCEDSSNCTSNVISTTNSAASSFLASWRTPLMGLFAISYLILSNK